MLPIQVTVRNTTLEPEIDADVRARVRRLRRYHNRIMGCRVTIDAPQGRRRVDAVRFAVRLDITVPGGEFVVTRSRREELRTALDNVFKAARRRLEDGARRRRGAVKAHESPPAGVVVEYYPLAGYGFIETPEGKRLYFDRRSVRRGSFRRLDVGSRVRFVEEEAERGPQASTVVPVT